MGGHRRVRLGLGLETKLTIAGPGHRSGRGVGRDTAAPAVAHALAVDGTSCFALVLWGPESRLAAKLKRAGPRWSFLRGHGEVIQAAVQGSISLNFDSGGMLAFIAFQPVLIGIVTLPVVDNGLVFFCSVLERLATTRRGRTGGISDPSTRRKGLLPRPALFQCCWRRACLQPEATTDKRGWSASPGGGRDGYALSGAVVVADPDPSGATVVAGQFWTRSGAQGLCRHRWLARARRPGRRCTSSSRPRSKCPRQSSPATTARPGAIDLLWTIKMNLPEALSPQLTFWYWKPSQVDAQTVVTVGIPEV